ncbi:hypothetical protein Tco_1304028 [Tanacetum coccineum]
MEKHLLVLTKRSLNASIVTTLVTLLGNVQQRGHMMERRRETLFINTEKLERKEKNQMGLLTMDDGIVNWGEHTENEETNHALMAINSSSEGDQEAQILAYSQVVKKLEAQLVTFQKRQLSLNEKLTFQANEIYEKDEKLKNIGELE